MNSNRPCDHVVDELTMICAVCGKRKEDIAAEESTRSGKTCVLGEPEPEGRMVVRLLE